MTNTIAQPTRGYSRTPFAARAMKLIGKSWTDDWNNKPTMEWDIRNNQMQCTVWPRNPEEEAMNNSNSINREKYEKIRKMNLHKMEPIPVCKIPN